MDIVKSYKMLQTTSLKKIIQGQKMSICPDRTKKLVFLSVSKQVPSTGNEYCNKLGIDTNTDTDYRRQISIFSKEDSVLTAAFAQVQG